MPDMKRLTTSGPNKAVSFEKGFSIVELLVVLALLLVVIPLVLNMWRFTTQSFDWSNAESRVLQDARLTIVRMEKEIRGARVATVGEAATVQATESDLRIYTDVTGDGIPERVEYFLVNGALWRRETAADNVSFPFTYSGTPSAEEVVIGRVNNTVLFQIAEVEENDNRRRVTIQIDIDDDDSPRPNPLQLTTTVTSRSR